MCLENPCVLRLTEPRSYRTAVHGVADPRFGARLCEAQHYLQFSRRPRPIRALAIGNTAAGRSPALRDRRFMESPDAFLARIGAMNLICISR